MLMIIYRTQCYICATKSWRALKRLASELLRYDEQELDEALSAGKLYEVESDE